MPFPPSVFVAMPYGVREARAAGADASSLQVDFNLVYRKLIQPALEGAGADPFRADEETAAGDIRTDMFFELITSDFVLADVSVHNPNVHYELGVRQGARPNGSLLIHGGWEKRPFDIAPDRTFAYDGRLFVSPVPADDAQWKERLAKEVTRLADVLKKALEADDRTVASPVFKDMPGLKPVEWSKVAMARTLYAGRLARDWRQRVEVAKRSGRPGDILTLADSAPIRLYREELLWVAADALFQLRRFSAALSVLEELLGIDPESIRAKTRKGLTLVRLGKLADAQVLLESVVEALGPDVDPETQGALGRVFKDLWRARWEPGNTASSRRGQALASAEMLRSSIRCYLRAFRAKCDPYNGVNVLTLTALLRHLLADAGEEPDTEFPELAEIATVVRFAARNAKADVWTQATLGEVELVAGASGKALSLYQSAATGPDTTPFALSSMLEQLRLFGLLEFKSAEAAPIRERLEHEQIQHPVPAAPAGAPRRAFVASGHMIDAPGRATERFPPRKESVVRDQMAAKLGEWKVSAGDVAICGGARGADILFAELCIERGAEVRLMLPLPLGEFLEESVRLAGSDWEDRLQALLDHPGVTTEYIADFLGPSPDDCSPFARNNLWMLHTAHAEADSASRLHILLVWDEKPTGDGPGGTSDFAARARSLGARIQVVNPTRL